MAQFGGDLNKYIDYLKTKEAEHLDRLVTPEELRRLRAEKTATPAKP